MCLSIPGRVTEISRDAEVLMGKVAFGAIVKGVCLEHVPEVVVGEYVLVHVGFAIARIDEEEAHRIFAFLETLNPMEELEPQP